MGGALHDSVLRIASLCALGRLAEESIEPEAKRQLLAAFRDWRHSRA
jgi:hypothetical protein